VGRVPTQQVDQAPERQGGGDGMHLKVENKI
jgi:hypothetical protein